MEWKPSITTWMRLEPRSRNAEMETSLQARVYDPLWMLARQWQFGEFQGEDNGSPIMAQWRGEAAPLTRFYPGAIAPNTMTNAPRYNSRLPLETLVEHEIVRPNTTPNSKPEKLRLAVQSGQHFLRMLDLQTLSTNYRTAFVQQYSFLPLTLEQRATLDMESRNYFDVMASRVPDARRLYNAFRSKGGDKIFIDPALQVAPGDAAEVEQTARMWLQWYESFFSEPHTGTSSWVSERMEYAFSVATRLSDREHILTAQEYSEGHLDWYDLDENLEVTLGAALDNPPRELSQKVIPAPVSFRGMPAARFWEFEDAQVDLGSVEAGPTDLARMLLVEFALAYGNDWFVIPVELEIGSLCKTHSLVITDTFGIRTLIKPIEDNAGWHMFQHSFTRSSDLSGSESNTFFLSPSLLKSLESKPVEEVLFLRDEMANLAWGVERLIESTAEHSLNRFEDYLERKRQLEGSATPEPTLPQDTLRYQLTTEVPDYWIPLMPVQTENGLRLRRGAVLKTDGSRLTLSALGRILEAGQRLALFEEELPREGIRVTRSYQFTRWIDGSSHLWIGRRKSVGRGEGSSGLKFDALLTK
jgi:hypothetical protein